jgi:hypothetical protein
LILVAIFHSSSTSTRNETIHSSFADAMVSILHSIMISI